MQNGIFVNSAPEKGMGYTDHEKQVKNALIDHKDYNRKTLYLFFMSGKTAFTAKGYMPFNKQFGFIYKQEIQEIIRTIAHELGHGAFRLRHPSSPECPYPQPEGQTNNLMDYVDASKALQSLALHKYQWDEVHDRDLGWNLFEDAGEAEAKNLLTTSWKEAQTTTGLFVTPSGFPIWLDNLSNVCVIERAESGFTGGTYPTQVLYGFTKDNVRYFAGFSGDQFTGFYNTDPNAKVTDTYQDKNGTTGEMLAQGNYTVLIWDIDEAKFIERIVDNNLWYEGEPVWANFTAAGYRQSVIDEYTYMPCGSYLREAKDSPLMNSHILKTAILNNPCILKAPRTLHFSGIAIESQWMKEFNLVFGTLTNVALAPALLQFGGSILINYSRQAITNAAIAASLDVSIQSVCIYLEGDENIAFSDVISKIDIPQALVSGAEGAIDNVYSDLSIPLYDAIFEKGKLKDNITPEQFIKDYAMGVTINLMTRGATSDLSKKYYKRIIVAYQKSPGNFTTKLSRIGLSDEMKKKFTNWIQSTLRVTSNRLDQIKSKLKNFSQSGGVVNLEKFADEVDAVADAFPNKNTDELVAQFGCFTANTPVLVSTGMKPIQDIHTGDTVMSRNLVTGKNEPKVVTNLKRYITKGLVALTLSTGATVQATPNHPFYTHGSFVEASALKPGDTLTSANNAHVIVTHTLFTDSSATVYNITVADNSNYFVTHESILVHNDCMLSLLNAYPNLINKVEALGDDLKKAFMLDFEKANKELLDAMNGEGMLEVWKGLINKPKWVRTNMDLLERIATKGDDYIAKVDEFYSPSVMKLPPNLKSPYNPPGSFNGIDYDKFGFPKLESYVSDRSHIVKITMDGSNDDYIKAYEKLKNIVGEGNIQFTNSYGSSFKIKKNGKWSEPYTWHHHQDGESMLPVLQSIHQNIQNYHTGGRSVVSKGLNGLFDSPQF